MEPVADSDRPLSAAKVKTERRNKAQVRKLKVKVESGVVRAAAMCR
jgi:hypothetical protein